MWASDGVAWQGEAEQAESPQGRYACEVMMSRARTAPVIQRAVLFYYRQGQARYQTEYDDKYLVEAEEGVDDRVESLLRHGETLAVHFVNPVAGGCQDDE